MPLLLTPADLGIPAKLGIAFGGVLGGGVCSLLMTVGLFYTAKSCSEKSNELKTLKLKEKLAENKKIMQSLEQDAPGTHTMSR